MTTKKQKTSRDPFYYEILARQFCDNCLMGKDTLTYTACHWQNITFVYNGKCYVELTEKDLNHRIRQYLTDNAIPQNNVVIGNVAPIVQTFIYQDKHTHKAMPFYKGKDTFPKPENVIAYNNGLLDLEAYLSGKQTLLEHTPLWVSTVCLPYDFNPDATCPKWEVFLTDAFDGDSEQIGLLQEWFGYCLTHDTSLQKFMIWQGLERAGKGTTWSILNDLVGQENSTGFSLFNLSYQFGLYPLVGKMVAYCGEVELKGCKDRGRILETLKGIVGEDTLHIEQKHNPYPISLVLPTRLVIACNEVPSFYETTGALSSRLLLLNYKKCFSGREDYGLKDKLRTELSGINNWALRGLARLRANGRFSMPNATVKAIQSFKRDNSPTLAFIQDCLIVESRLDRGNLSGVETTEDPLTSKGKVIEEAYRQWCLDNGLNALIDNWFWRNLKTNLGELDNKGRGDVKVYSGIALKHKPTSILDAMVNKPTSLLDTIKK